MENFIYDYFISPIWDHSGYNMVNTLTYVAIAIAAVYLIYRQLKGKVQIDGRFIMGVLSFVLVGSTMRVVTDAIDTKVFAPITPLHSFILESHLFDYGYLTVSPGIYIVTAAMYLVSLWISHKAKNPILTAYIGIILWLPLFMLLIPFMRYAVYALPIIILAAIPAYLAWAYLKDMGLAAIVAGQALDGAATFFVIDIFSKISGITYFEQHVVSSAIGKMFGTFFVFYLLKVGIALAAAIILSKEKDEITLLSFAGKDIALNRYYIAIVLIVIGFAPGIRDMLRMVIGA
jgi:uncharacterized membrane protein